MTYIVERLSELSRHLAHLRDIRPWVPDRAALERDLTTHNDVMFSLLMAAQLVIGIAGELSARATRAFPASWSAPSNACPAFATS